MAGLLTGYNPQDFFHPKRCDRDQSLVDEKVVEDPTVLLNNEMKPSTN